MNRQREFGAQSRTRAARRLPSGAVVANWSFDSWSSGGTLEATLVLMAVCAVSAFALTAVFRTFALRKGILDVPVERSSHLDPVPRGGGVAVVVSVLVAVLVSTVLGLVPPRIGWGLIASGLAVSLVGFVDDLVGVSPMARLGVHILAAVWLGFWIGVPTEMFHESVSAGFIWSALACLVALLYLVWNINLYNFMDGIDGIASMQMIFLCSGLSLILATFECRSVECTSIDVLTGSLSGASLGFLAWNFPKAKVFLGDVGSGFLGVMVGGISLVSALQSPLLLWSVLILMGVFVVDATYTLIRRVLGGASPVAAHRTHAYQILVGRFGNHWQVTLAVLAVNVCWLLPWAFAVAGRWVDGPTAVAISYFPLVAVASMLGAGTKVT